MSTDDTTPSAPQFNPNDDSARRPADSDPAPASDHLGGEHTGSRSTSTSAQEQAPQASQPSGLQQPAYGAQGQSSQAAPGQQQYGGQGQPQYGAPGQPQYGAAGQPQHGAAGQPQYGGQDQPYGQGQSYGAPTHGATGAQGYQAGSQGYQAGGQGYRQNHQQGHQSGPYQFSGMQPQDARLWATLTHLAAPALYLLSAGFAGFVAPLILWLVFKEKDPLVRQAGAGSFNFNFALMLISIAAWVLGIVTLGLLLPLTGVVLTIVFIVQVVFGILGAMAANKGEAYKYPFEVRILK